jgi:hypothetical protein
MTTVRAMLGAIAGISFYWGLRSMFPSIGCFLVGHDEVMRYVPDGERIHTDGSPWMHMVHSCRRCGRTR